MSPIDRSTLGKITLRSAFIGSSDDLINKFIISIETDLPPVLGPPAVSLAANVAAAGIALIRWLLLDVQNWVNGRDAFPAHQAVALSVMGRVIQAAVDRWNGEIAGTCPDQVSLTDAVRYVAHALYESGFMLTCASQLNLAKPLLGPSGKSLFIAPYSDVMAAAASNPEVCIPPDGWNT